MTQHPLIPALIPMHLFTEAAPVSVDLVYASPVHARNIFAQALYHPNARLWLHEDLAKIVLLAAYHLRAHNGWKLQLKDGLRTIEAQAKMLSTDIVKDNPHWTAPGDNRLLSPPGAGAHPRGMAIDIGVVDMKGREVNMGTPFDHLTPDPANNPAARDYTALPDEILERREAVEHAFTHSAGQLGLSIVPLASEWWDYRFPADWFKQYEPLSDADLPDYMKMCGRPADPVIPDEIEVAYEAHAVSLLLALEPFKPDIQPDDNDNEDLQNAS